MPSPEVARPTVVVYTHSLLEPSMTFVLSHAEALRRYGCVFAGSHRVRGLALPEDRVVTANRGGISGLAREYLFRRFGMAGHMATELRKFRPSLVHAHFGLSGPAALALAGSLEVPMIVTYHGRDATITPEQARRSRRGREYLRGSQRLIQGASLIIAVSDFIRARLLDQGCPASKVVTHRNGIDVNFFRPAGRRRESFVLFVGRFVEKKGCEYLVRALGRLREKGLPTRAVLIGDGPGRPALERLVGQAGADVAFTGFLALTQVRDWLEKASVVVVPSVTAANGDSEGLPTVILEAQAMGTPVVATRHAGNAEGVLEGQSALLVDERDVAGLAEAIEFFLTNPAAVESFGANGREFVKSRFDIGAQVAGLERIYDRARGIS
jgi:colanic acid/amylovoran biosynthesis glycosyltransferase